MEAGHPDARFYPLGMVFDEQRLVVARHNRLQASEATVMRTAMASILDKKSHAEFKKMVKRLTEE